MKQPRKLSKLFMQSSLLILAVIALSNSTPHSNSQALTTTLAIVTTVRTEYTTSTENQALPIFSGVITIRADPSTCPFKTLTFTAIKGDRISGILTSNQSINFYVMSEENYAKWDAAPTCEVKAFNPLIDERQILSYSLDMVFLADAKYRIIFMNYSIARTAEIKFDAKITRARTVVLPIYFSATLLSVLTLTQTFGLLVLAGADYSQILVVVGVVAAVGIGGAIAASRSRKKKGPPLPPAIPATQPQEQPVFAPEPMPAQPRPSEYKPASLKPPEPMKPEVPKTAVAVPTVKPEASVEIQEYQDKLARLEELRSKGRVKESVYHRLRTEYEQKLSDARKG